jgi:hypothetical protein
MRVVGRVLTPRRILALAVVGVLLYAYPGLVSYDSVDQLDQARRWDLGDWHPPAMAALWRGVELFIGGPFGMLLAQTIGLVLGANWILRDRLSPHAAALGALVVAWFPPILTVTGVVWKDGQMAGYLMLGIAALCSPRPRVRWLGVLAIFLASAVRHNAPAATLAPLVLLWRPSSEERSGSRSPLRASPRARCSRAERNTRSPAPLHRSTSTGSSASHRRSPTPSFAATSLAYRYDPI